MLKALRRAKSASRTGAVAVTGSMLAFSGLTLVPVEAAEGALNLTKLKDFPQFDQLYDYPTDRAVVGNKLFFVADDGVKGNELWMSDGTSAGTTLVKDIVPGASSSSPSDLVAVGSTLFFATSSQATGRELWKSNGTAASTVLVKDIAPGSYEGYGNDSSPRGLTAVGSTLFFTANDGSTGRELWKSTGTAASTVLVKDIHPGNDYSYSYADSLTAVGSTLFFTADDGINGRELWKSTGTAASTVLVKDIAPANSYEYPQELTAIGNKLFFTAQDNTAGRELWKSTGTSAGTVMVKDIDPGSYEGYGSSSHPYQLTTLGTTLFFTADDSVNGRELWKSSGTAASTTLVKDIYAGDNQYSDRAPGSLTAVGNTLFFSADDGTTGYELWKSTGTAATTELVKDIKLDTYDSIPRELTAVGNRLFFTARDGVHGNELWTSDGTAANTTLVSDIIAGTRDSNPDSLIDLGGALLFFADRPAPGRVRPESLYRVGVSASSAPGPVQSLSATPSNTTASVVLSWVAPTSDGGSPITNYVISRAGVSDVVVSGSSTSRSITGLALGTSYTFTVKARSVNGDSLGTQVSTVTHNVPAVPTSVTASRTGTTAVINWQPPTDDGGRPVTGYDVRIDGGAWVARGATIRTQSFTGVPTGTHTLEVRAKNSMGPGTTVTTTVN